MLSLSLLTTLRLHVSTNKGAGPFASCYLALNVKRQLPFIERAIEHFLGSVQEMDTSCRSLLYGTTGLERDAMMPFVV